ncbi:MAG TPA: acyl-CoA dehydrogenase family protein [Hyphomicrobiaceae bacterium]|nr:acyl-CoA dehydrogenase family protein [Hyphomicrobiaceae bacterium]
MNDKNPAPHSPSLAADPVARVASIADVLRRAAPENEKLGRLTPAVVDKLHEQRLFRLLLPAAYGGDEADLATWFRTMEAIAKNDASTAWCVGQINGCAASSAALAPEIAQKMWGENARAALSWGPPIQSRAEETEGGHLLTGEWGMSSGSRHASWLGLMAPVFDRAGKPVPLPQGVSARIFFVPTDAVEWIDNWDVIGLNATCSGGYRLAGRFVPAGYSFSREHLPDVRLPGALFKFPLNSLFATGFSGVSLGIARAMLNEVMTLAREKTPRLAKSTLRDNHHVQFQIGDAEARLRSARHYVESTVTRVWEEVVSSGKLTIERRIDIRMAATFAIHEANKVADTVWQIAGATAIFSSSAFERRLRDIKTLTQQVQGRQSHLQDVGAYLMGLEPSLAFA